MLLGRGILGRLVLVLVLVVLLLLLDSLLQLLLDLLLHLLGGAWRPRLREYRTRQGLRFVGLGIRGIII